MLQDANATGHVETSVGSQAMACQVMLVVDGLNQPRKKGLNRHEVAIHCFRIY